MGTLQLQDYPAAQALKGTLPSTEWRALELWLGTFFPFQLDWLLDFSRFALLLKARQTGASHTFAAAAVLWGMLGESTAIVSVGERESCDVLDKAKRHATALTKLGSKWARVDKSNAEEARLASGGRIISLPSTSGARGYAANVILDEFAYHKAPENVWDAASGATTHGFRLRVISTPNGVGNLFHKLCTDPKQSEGYTQHRVTLDEAKKDGLAVDEQACWRQARGDPRVFDQLFRCSFLDAEEQYIPTALILDASEANTGKPSGDCYAGLDIGLTNDLTSLAVLRIAPDGRRWVQEVETCRRTSWDDQFAMIMRSHHRWRWRRMCVDATGIGKVPAEILVRKFGGTVVNGRPIGGTVEPVDFTLKTKEDLATTLYACFANKRVAIPTGDTALRDDLCALRRIVTSAGNIRYDATRNADGHADRAWALALALHACARPSSRRDLTNLEPG